jgi:serine/threonine protein kinase
MVDYSAQQSTTDGESVYSVKSYFEYPAGDLAYDIEERAKRQEIYSSSELKQLVSDMTEAVTHLASQKMVHGDLRPKYFAYSQAEKRYRLLDRLGAPAPAWQVQQANLIAGVDLYMSPQLFTNLSRRNQRFRHDPFKSEVFALGMILLEAGTLESAAPIYDQQSQSVGFSKRDRCTGS